MSLLLSKVVITKITIPWKSNKGQARATTIRIGALSSKTFSAKHVPHLPFGWVQQVVPQVELDALNCTKPGSIKNLNQCLSALCFVIFHCDRAVRRVRSPVRTSTTGHDWLTNRPRTQCNESRRQRAPAARNLPNLLAGEVRLHGQCRVLPMLVLARTIAPTLPSSPAASPAHRPAVGGFGLIANRVSKRGFAQLRRKRTDFRRPIREC
jgi:hypothetical protein